MRQILVSEQKYSFFHLFHQTLTLDPTSSSSILRLFLTVVLKTIEKGTEKRKKTEKKKRKGKRE